MRGSEGVTARRLVEAKEIGVSTGSIAAGTTGSATATPTSSFGLLPSLRQSRALAPWQSANTHW